METSRKTTLGHITISEENGRITGLAFMDSGTVGTNRTLDEAFVQLDEYLSRERREFDLRYAFEGTDFQRRAWNALLTIPYGTVISYRQEARMIGNPRSCRAVGSANGRNPIPIFVPCHRVIRSDGALGGYSSGLDVKRRLLELEGAEWTSGRNS